MKIAQIAPLTESVPPQKYGGAERIVSYLTEELVRQGHEVTLFASGDSRTSAQLHSIVPTALRLNPLVKDPWPYAALQLEAVRTRAYEFDVLHFHCDYYHFPLVRALGLGNTVTTLHGRLDFPGYGELFETFGDTGLVSISEWQRAPLAHCNWLATVPHGLPPGVCTFEPDSRGDYVAFLGRISREKRIDRAIEIAGMAGMKLKIAAKVDSTDRKYFEEEIEPLLAQPHVEFLGEIDEREKCAFLGHAAALLVPIDRPDPFGLVMIEAMSCGTPCVAWRAGSVAEIISEGTNGFIVESTDEAVAAVHQAALLDRRAVRANFQQRFAVDRMTRDYMNIYHRVAERRPRRAA